MKHTLFEIPYYSISISDWKKKKVQLKKLLKNFPVSKATKKAGLVLAGLVLYNMFEIILTNIQIPPDPIELPEPIEME